jgi:molybdenum cofactor synthesis domain-containing protein
MSIRVAVLTVSDRGAAGDRADDSGDAITDWLRQCGCELVHRGLVPDESDQIARTLAQWADEGIADLILTTGGTGLGPRDVTPEATRAAIDRETPGIAEAIRADGRCATARAVLSRGVAGVRAASLIVNLPGGVGGVRAGLATLEPFLDHAVTIIRHEPTDH